jgi:O-methyltransferase
VQDPDLARLIADTEHEILDGARSVAVLGLTRVALDLLERLRNRGLHGAVRAIHAGKDPGTTIGGVPVLPVEDLIDHADEVLVVASDEDKEQLLLDALPYLGGTPKVVVAGYAHLAFRDQVFEEVRAQLIVPSIANGYPNCLVHIYQCLRNAARLGVSGAVVEFGMFKGGTTLFMAEVARRLGRDWPVIGFDTFAGFPPRRSALDMYDHPDCVFTDLDAVRALAEPRGIRIVAGDIVETAQTLRGRDVVLSFVDTDNYSSAAAALDVVEGQTVVGGAVVFDHFTGVDKFRYTLGERVAGKRLLDDPRWFHLHGTGVFLRQR